MTETLRCKCGGEVRVVRLGRSLLTMGHVRNPAYLHHAVRLAPASRSASQRSQDRPLGQGRTARTGVAGPSGTPERVPLDSDQQRKQPTEAAALSIDRTSNPSGRSLDLPAQASTSASPGRVVTPAPAGRRPNT